MTRKTLLLLVPALLALGLAACGADTPAASEGDGGAGDASSTDGGCSNLCGTTCCSAEQTCNPSTHACEVRCTPLCGGRACGPDHCGGVCGTCGAGKLCDEARGECFPCNPSCSGKSCGSDGCGGQCGSCGAGTVCDGAKCVACTPKSCGQLGKNCGDVPDGCGGTLRCGDCPAGQSCGGGGMANVCACPKATCAQLGKNCGLVPDGCGGMLKCGDCAAGESCGAGGVPNVCGTGTCIPKSCQDQGKNCGVVSDGCGSTMACSPGCTSPNTCGGGGVANVCGCTQESDATLCARAGRSCGTLQTNDSCLVARTVNCGGCSAPQTCGGGGTPGVCGCTPQSDADFCRAQGRVCGTATGTDNCGGTRTVTCGSCPTGQTCTASGTCQLPCGNSNCAGCCRNGVCETGKDLSACGSAGGACVACTGIQICTASQRCGVDPSSIWIVQPSRASIDAMNGTTDWDPDQSAPDVYVTMSCPPSATPNSTTTPLSASFTPAWTSGGCLAKASALLAEPYLFQVWDEDPFLPDDPVTGPLKLQLRESDFTAGSVSLGRQGSMSSMTIKLIKQ